MRVLLVHNHYQLEGGEDQVFAAEGGLLEAYGHEVFRYTVHNDEVRNRGAIDLARTTVWSRQAYDGVRTLIRLAQPDVMHVHNTLPLLSPSVYYAARACGVAVVQTLHNYRLLCPNALFFRQGHVCEDCLGRSIPWPAVRHACYRDSRAASAVVATLLSAHRAAGTWQRCVDRFIALTTFARQKFIQGGLPAERILVKPNFTADPGPRTGPGSYALFVGRLSVEKGIDTLLEAWRQTRVGGVLKVVGDGPLADKLAACAAAETRLQWVGPQPHDRVIDLMRGASFLIVPSVCYETFALVVVEAYALGLPVIASNLGALSSIVHHGATGLHFRSGDPGDLAAGIEWAFAHPLEMGEMGANARLEFELKYTPERNHELLTAVYREAISHASSGTHRARALPATR